MRISKLYESLSIPANTIRWPNAGWMLAVSSLLGDIFYVIGVKILLCKIAAPFDIWAVSSVSITNQAILLTQYQSGCLRHSRTYGLLHNYQGHHGRLLYCKHDRYTPFYYSRLFRCELFHNNRDNHAVFKFANSQCIKRMSILCWPSRLRRWSNIEPTSV